MPQSEGFGLADIYAFDMRRDDFLNDFQGFDFVANCQFVFQFLCLVEMIGYRPLGTSGDKDHYFDPRINSFLHRVLN